MKFNEGNITVKSLMLFLYVKIKTKETLVILIESMAKHYFFWYVGLLIQFFDFFSLIMVAKINIQIWIKRVKWRFGFRHRIKKFDKRIRSPTIYRFVLDFNILSYLLFIILNVNLIETFTLTFYHLYYLVILQ